MDNQQTPGARNLPHHPDPGGSLAPFRVGSVRFLNAVPLTRGLEHEVLFTTPSQLAAMLQRDALDAALVSVTEALLHDRYDILDGLAIISRGEVQSVFLAHRRPINDIREVFCDTASLTSVNLLRVLLAERGLQPKFKPLPSYDFTTLPDYALLIGDTALDFARSAHRQPGAPTCSRLSGCTAPDTARNPDPHAIWDLGQAWWELTQLPFVYAVWALRRATENARLRRQLTEAGRFGIESLDAIIRDRTDYDYAFRKTYFTRHIHFAMGDEEKRGLARFVELLRKHGAGPVFEPRFV